MWEYLANYCHDIFGSFIGWDERFFICPDCEEPIYECDWSDEELEDQECPICGFYFLEGENGEECGCQF